ncbi:nicotinate-nucleotide--dimethylbenzimidazole phosphoribosyltransferase [Streptomyces sp. MMCC 100]|uniref:nicotinate-nucleotide--dimethylbenzimidazole phosphoribosyltransferase n=1 Tax=Streptomyces sp. MMCC 100 TaxID=3163555 RepID=UPI003597A701
MTDTGQIPGEGLPENAGMVEQPGVPAPGAYTYLSEATTEDEDLLLLPGAQSAWGNEVAPPAPEPVVETVHQPGPHEMSGRDSGSVDLSGVRLPDPAQDPVSAPAPARRPLHLGPPIPDTSASPVRSLADRGPADAPVRHPGPPTAGPEYLDVPPAAAVTPQAAAPWGAQQVAPQAQEVPVNTGAGPAETVVPLPEQAPEPVGAAQALVTRVATEAVAATGVAAPGAVEPGEPREESAPEAAQNGRGGQAEQDGPAVPAVQEAPAVSPAPNADAEQAAAPEQEAVPTPEAVTAEPVTEAQEVPVTPEVQEAPAIPEVQEAPEQSAPGDAPAAAPEGLEEPRTADVAEAPASQEAPPSEASGAEGADARTPDVPAAVGAFEAAAPEPSAAPEQPAPVQEEPAQPQPVAQPAPEDAAPHPQPDVRPAPQFAVPQPDPEAAQPAPEAPAPQPAQGPQSLVDTDVPQEQEQEQEPGQEQEVAVAEGTPEYVGTDAPATGATAQEPLPTQAQVQAHAQAHAPAAPEPHPGRPVGQFVPVDGGQVPTTPHLAPTPPEAVLVPPEAPAPEQVTADAVAEEPVAEEPVAEEPVVAGPTAAVPAPREADPELLQSADDLDTRGAGPEDHAAGAADATEAPDTAHAEPAPQEVPALQEAPATQEDPHEVSAAAEAEVRQPAGPAAPAYDDAEREAVLKVMRERRDIRNGFRSDPIPHEVLLRVLEAAHTAPSVGHSQPWDFVVIRSADTRRAMHELAMRQRDAYAKSLPKGRAKQFKELKIEAILDTPVNIVVTADPTRGGRHTLGRHTQPQMAPYSSALAVENLWLAARAEGLGVGWVSFFDEREMVRALGLPEHLDVVAYLCVGYVDEFPDEPELMQAGWSKRRPLSWVVHEETYGRRALPGEAPHDLLAETVAQIRPLDAKALGEAWERQKRMTKPAGALGMLEIISAQLSGLSRQCPPPIPEPAAVAVFAGDHGVHAQGVTPWPQEVTAQMVANFLGGGAVCNAFATQVGAEVCVVDVGVATDLPATPGLLPRKVRAGTSDMTTGAAMTREEAKQAIEVGIETARDLVAAGNKALLTGEMGIANTTASAALISVFTGADPAEVTGRGTGINDETLARKTEVVRRALELHQPDPADPIGVLAAIGGFEHAAMVGLLLGGASLRTPVILDGVSAGAAALVARAIAPEVLAACIAGHRSAEPGHVAALNKLGLRPLVDLDLRLGEGTGALLALPMVQSTARAMHEVATFDSAGVTEK